MLPLSCFRAPRPPDPPEGRADEIQEVCEIDLFYLEPPQEHGLLREEEVF